MFKEFKEFALKGNLIDLAVAFVMGAAFTKLSTAFIEDLFMPLISAMMPGGLDFTNRYLPLSSEVTILNDLALAKKQGAIFAYGNFVTIGLNFLIVAFAMFLVVKAINKAKALAEKPVVSGPPKLSTEEKLLVEIRDLLKEKV